MFSQNIVMVYLCRDPRYALSLMVAFIVHILRLFCTRNQGIGSEVLQLMEISDSVHAYDTEKSSLLVFLAIQTRKSV